MDNPYSIPGTYEKSFPFSESYTVPSQCVPGIKRPGAQRCSRIYNAEEKNEWSYTFPYMPARSAEGAHLLLLFRRTSDTAKSDY